ncbi:MAG: winged helix-turn-helix domain-containing protein [Firmicutes bacterium]|nr:winged helix-turn-helix domain-containing protein [Bacillota bacterium]MCM1401841.1 winged helix-turn-helix domain-containing protein [Bacteroides sp.]MCM1477726.1 winged helix-turn-helix domain-containing protein [Bacteroides sp.]
MTTDTIGSWAGLVWNALNEADVLGIKQLKKMTKLKEKEVYAALGWLARENKVTFEESGDEKAEILVALVK